LGTAPSTASATATVPAIASAPAPAAPAPATAAAADLEALFAAPTSPIPLSQPSQQVSTPSHQSGVTGESQLSELSQLSPTTPATPLAAGPAPAPVPAAAANDPAAGPVGGAPATAANALTKTAAAAASTWLGAEETTLVIARVLPPGINGMQWCPWLKQHGEAVLASLTAQPLAAALAAWQQQQQQQHRAPEAGTLEGPVPFYVNRSKRALDKAGGFCQQLAARLTHLAAQAGGAADHAESSSGAGSGQSERGCPTLVAALQGWQLEVGPRAWQILPATSFNALRALVSHSCTSTYPSPLPCWLWRSD